MRRAIRAIRAITLVGAPTSIGIKPGADGRPRGLDRAPGVLRRLGLASRVGAHDDGDASDSKPGPYRDFTCQPGQIRNEREIVEYTRALGERVAGVIAAGRFPLVLGGDCSIVLASLLGVRQGGYAPVGLAYLDGHADFASPAESRTGSAASMCLRLAAERLDTPLSRLVEGEPLVEPTNVALVGRRDAHEPWYGQDSLPVLGVLDLPGDSLRRNGIEATAAATLARVARPEVAGFWIHLDADVLDAAVMPAVDSPEPDGPGLEDLACLLRPLVGHPRALGMELTIYDPDLDPGQVCGERLVTLLEAALVS